jgi:hypothetical protein
MRVATERKGTSARPLGRQMTSRMRIGSPDPARGSGGVRIDCSCVRTKVLACKARYAPVSGSNISSHGSSVAPATSVTISTRVPSSASTARFHSRWVSLLAANTASNSRAPMACISCSIRAASVGAGSKGYSR